MKKITQLAMGAILLGIVVESHASLTSYDLLATGDGLLTYDSDTKLSWLDLTATVGQSYNQVMAGFGGFTTDQGFRYATGDEVGGLFTAAGISQGADPQISAKAALMNLLGGYLYYNFWSTQSYAVTGSTTLSVPGVSHDFAMLGYDNFYSPNSYAYQTYGVIGDNDSAYYFGSFLVKDVSSVPIPSAMLLFGTGLVGFLGAQFKRKR